MKGFIEVTLSFNGISKFLINVNNIESVVRCDNGCATIYSNVVESNNDNVEQVNYTTQNTYEEVKTMIEEAMK